MILYIGNFLSKHGYNPTICELLSPKLKKLYPIKTASDRRNIILRFLDMIFALFFNLGKVKLVLIDTYSTRAFWFAYFIGFCSKLLGIKYIPIVHGGCFEKRMKNSPTKTRYFLSNAYKIVTPSTFIKQLLEKHDFRNLVPIPNFIPIENYKFTTRQTIRPKLLWIRSFHKIYNPLLTVEIIERLIQKGYSPDLCMIGPEKDSTLTEIKKMILDKNLGKYIKLTGRLEKEQLIRVTENYDIFINTTNVDTFPLSIIEAMALGLPVVSTNVGGISYDMKDNIDGLLVEPNNAKLFVEKIEALLNDKKLTETLIRNGRIKAEKVDWNEVESQWRQLINKVF